MSYMFVCRTKVDDKVCDETSRQVSDYVKSGKVDKCRNELTLTASLNNTILLVRHFHPTWH